MCYFSCQKKVKTCLKLENGEFFDDIYSIFLILCSTEESDEEDERPTRRRRMAERAAEGIEDDEEVWYQMHNCLENDLLNEILDWNIDGCFKDKIAHKGYHNEHSLVFCARSWNHKSWESHIIEAFLSHCSKWFQSKVEMIDDWIKMYQCSTLYVYITIQFLFWWVSRVMSECFSQDYNFIDIFSNFLDVRIKKEVCNNLINNVSEKYS